MKLLLFDWHGDGHHGIYMERTVQALASCCRLAVAAPDAVLPGVAECDVEPLPLGEPRPILEGRREQRELAAREQTLLERAVRLTRADYVFHLYSDPLLEYLDQAEPLGIPTMTAVFFARWHYPWAYGSLLLPRDAARAFRLERAVQKWRRRENSLAVFSVDEAAVVRWNRRSGAPAHWLPEPPVPAVDESAPERRGCILYGTLSPRKGIDRLAAALARDSSDVHAVLAGPAVSDAYAREIDRLVAVMRRGGAAVDLRRWPHEEGEALALLREARCTVLPYHRHGGASRVLLESAASGTPVLVHDYGLVAALVRRHGLGLVVDCGDRAAFRRALHRMSAEGEIEGYSSALRRFADRYNHEMFSAALRAPLGLSVQSSKEARVAAR